MVEYLWGVLSESSFEIEKFQTANADFSTSSWLHNSQIGGEIFSPVLKYTHAHSVRSWQLKRWFGQTHNFTHYHTSFSLRVYTQFSVINATLRKTQVFRSSFASLQNSSRDKKESEIESKCMISISSGIY